MKFRQRAIVTAFVYFKRFYLLNSFKEYDPHLLVPTTIYLASKVRDLT